MDRASSSPAGSSSESPRSPDSGDSSTTQSKRRTFDSSDSEDSNKRLKGHSDAEPGMGALHSPEPEDVDSTTPEQITEDLGSNGDIPAGPGADRPPLERQPSTWRLELCSGTDETLQLSRLSGPHKQQQQHMQGSQRRNSSENSPDNENALDSYRIETLAIAETATTDAFGDIPDGYERWCDATISAQHVAITIGNQINILSADCKAQEAVICHDSRIMATALNCDSSFVAFGDDTGALFIVHIRTRRPVFSQAVCKPNTETANSASPSKPSHSGIAAMSFAVSGLNGEHQREELVLASSNGTLIRFSDIDLCLLSQAILKGDMALAAEIKSNIKIEFVSLTAGKRAIHADDISGLAVAYSENQSSIIVSGSGSASMSRWMRSESSIGKPGQEPLHPTRLADLVSTECSGSGYVKMRLSLDHRYLVALNEQGTLDVYESSTLTLVFRYSKVPIDDFSLVAPSSSNTSEVAPTSIMVAAISKPVSLSDNEDGEEDIGNGDDDDDDDDDNLCRKLVVVSLPSMDLVYTMDVSVWTWLANDTRSAQDIADTIMFVEGTVGDGSRNLFLRSLCETVPLERLSHFLRAGRYAEAEAFAEACNIPLSTVHRRRLEELLKEQDPQLFSNLQSEEGALAQHVGDVFDMLGHIDDDEFAIDVCIRLHIPSYRETLHLLQHARSLAANRGSDTALVEETIQRLGTWDIVGPSETTCSSGFDARSWHIFREADLAACLRSYIAKSDISRASAIWRRHQSDKRLLGDISGAIQGFPLSMETGPLVGWLRAEVLHTIQSHHQWHDVAAWIEQRARALEAKQKSPSDALLLVELLDLGSWTAGLGAHSTALVTGEAIEAAPSAIVRMGSSVDGPFAVTPQQFIDNSLRASSWTMGLARFSGADIFPSATDQKHTSNNDSGMQSCAFLHKQLLDLAYLRESHGMTLSLEEYDNLSYSMVAVELLDRVAAPELLPEAYFSHFLPYSHRHQLDYPQILKEYCVDTMDAVDREDADDAGALDNAEEDIAAPNIAVPSRQGRHSWEPRVLQLLSCLYLNCAGKHTSGSDSSMAVQSNLSRPPLTTPRESMLATYFEIVLEVMRRSSIPWSPGIERTIEESLKLMECYADLDAELSRRNLEIREQYRLMCLKRMLFSHGLPDFHISNTKMAYPLLQWLVQKTDSETVMADALQLVDAYHHLSRTSAYVLRLQALCESCNAERVSDFMFFIDATEYSSEGDRPAARGDSQGPDSSQPMSKYIPMEVARRVICWIREVLDSMSFTGDSSRSQFKQFVGAGMAIVRSLEALAQRYSQAIQSPDASMQGSRGLPLPLLDKLTLFLAGEKGALGVVWQLLTDGGIMVSPGELEQRHMRSQILSELLEQQWLRPYIDESFAGSTGKQNKSKGKSTKSSPRSPATPIGMLGLPHIPASIKTLAAMLEFSPAQLVRKTISVSLSLGLFGMALDACQHLIETLKPLPPSALSSNSRRHDTTAPAAEEWHAAIGALAACEQAISAYLAGAESCGSDKDEGGSGTRTPSEKMQGVLVKRLMTVCQAASLKCAFQPHLASFLDAYSSWELAHSIFSQTTDGDFAALTRNPSPAGASAMPVPPHSAWRTCAGSSGSAAAGSSSGSAHSISYADESFGSVEDATDGSDSISSTWLSSLFINAYVERGLVLDTADAMNLVYRLIAVLRRLPTADGSSNSSSSATGENDGNSAESTHGEPKGKKPKAPSGKSVDRSLSSKPKDDALLDSLSADELRHETIHRCRNLVAFLALNRHWMLAVQTLELVVSQLSRSSFVVQEGTTPDSSSEELSLLRQRLSSGGISSDELQMLFEPSSAPSGKPNAVDVQGLASKTLVRSLQQRGIDSVFIFSCMIMTPPARAYQCLSTAMSHSGLLPSRVIALANIGAACSLVWQQQALLDRCRSVAAAARWSEQLHLLQIKFDVTLLSDPKPQLLEPLIRPMLIKTSMDITTVLEFANEFRLDETFAVLEYISLCCTAPKIDGYQARVLGIEGEIANTKLLERTYVDGLENGASAYDYERLQFIVQRLQELRPQDQGISRFAAVLDILCSYDRKSRPPYEELLQEWTRTQAARSALQQFSEGDECAQETGGMDAGPPYQFLVAQYPLAEKRLPFHYLVNTIPWTTLLPELAVDTVDLLLPLAKPLDLSEDDFYMNLIDGMLKQWKASSPPSEGERDATTAYELAVSKTPAHFNSIQQLIRCFKDPEAAISTIKHVADELPCGPNRIAALRLGIKLLRKWGQSIRRMAEPERRKMMAKADTIYTHFMKSFTDAMTEVTLRKNGLEKYLPLFVEAEGTDATTQALRAVYEGECESALCKPKREGREALHETLRNLAAAYDIGLDPLLHSMLTAYLEAPVVLAESTAQLQLPSTRYQASLRLPASHEAQLRRRIVCILRVYSAAEAVGLLLPFAYGNKSGISCLCRARALEILFSLASHEEISRVQQPGDVHKYFQALLYLADFEFVGIPQTTSDFLECSKAALARSIWVDYHEDPRAIQLICNMCLDFGVDDSDLILRMLPRLLSAKMFRYTAGVLEVIGGMSCYSSIAELPMFWNQAVAGCIAQTAEAGSPGWVGDTLTILGSCLRSLYLPDIDAGAIIEKLIGTAGNDDSASVPVLLAFAVYHALPCGHSASNLLRSYISAIEPKQVHSLILALLEFAESASKAAGSRLFVSWETSRGLTLIFDYVDTKGAYEQTLLHHPLGRAVRAFVHNRMHHDKLATAIMACLERGKKQLAMQLVCQYYRTRPAETIAEDAMRAGISIGAEAENDSGDNTTHSSDTDTPLGTDDAASATSRLLRKVPDERKLDVYIGSHK
ncbi:hypothetical protein GQ54DRAFT_297499 [Martensiomyces pterosporus]|nr:hypothetical protein GQ54DRAFT_297499 [Martensiomyces pterosporus]